MNYSFMQKLQSANTGSNSFGPSGKGTNDLLENMPGQRLGQGLKINPAKAGLTPAAQALAKAPGQQDKLSEDFPQTLGETFANVLIQRMDIPQDENGQSKDTSSLRQNLASTMDWVRDRFGDETAAAAAGMILQSTSGGVTEDSLGEGLLNTLKFIDRNFGVAAGDAAMSQFNSGINGALNDFFDNGFNEVFYAAESTPGQPSATQDLNARFFMQAAEVADGKGQATSLTEEMLNKLKEELDKKGELQNLATQLKEEMSPAAPSADQFAAAYAPAVETMPQLTDMVV